MRIQRDACVGANAGAVAGDGIVIMDATSRTLHTTSMRYITQTAKKYCVRGALPKPTKYDLKAGTEMYEDMRESAQATKEDKKKNIGVQDGRVEWRRHMLKYRGSITFMLAFLWQGAELV